MDAVYDVLRSAAEFETLAARSADPHVKAVYLKLAQRYRDRGGEKPVAGPKATPPPSPE